MYTKVKDIEHLSSMLDDDEPVEFFINFGLFISSKSIMLIDGVYNILNKIDDRIIKIPENELLDHPDSNIGKAIKEGRFYRYGRTVSTGMD